MNQIENPNSGKDDLNDLDKEIEKLKELAENGMELTDDLKRLKESEDPLENAFANHIIAFENASNNADLRPLKEILGNPIFPDPIKLTDDELDKQLLRANEILAQKNIYLQTIYPTSNRIIYKFIIDELLENTDGFIDLPDLNTNYIYEEFHPNHKEDLKKNVEDILEALSQKDLKEFTCFYADEILFKKQLHSEVKFIERINQQFEIFHELDKLQIITTEIDFIEDSAVATCVFHIEHLLTNGERIFLNLEANFEFKMLYGFYCLTAIGIPKLGM